jgi:hypothetical protein
LRAIEGDWLKPYSVVTTGACLDVYPGRSQGQQRNAFDLLSLKGRMQIRGEVLILPNALIIFIPNVKVTDAKQHIYC